MSFRRFTPKRKSERKRQIGITVPQQSDETKRKLEYDETKNSVCDIENGMNNLRKKLKTAKKHDAKGKPESLQSIQNHVRSDIHPYVEALNKCLSIEYKEVGDLKSRLQIKDNDISSLEDDLKKYENQEKQYQKDLADADISFQQQLQEKDKAIERMRLDFTKLEQQLQEKENTIGILRKEQEDLKAKLEESEKRADVLDTAKKTLEDEKSHLIEELQKRENDINRLKLDLQSQHESHELLIQQKQAEMERELLKKDEYYKLQIVQTIQQKDEEIRSELQKRDGFYSQQIAKLIQQKDDEIGSWKAEVERRQNTIQTLVSQREEERQAKEEERKQKDEALTRLSAIAGDRLRNNNPGITDLSDPNRPMKIAEKFTEMYDNDWTDSMEALEDLGISEDEGVNVLLHFLTDSYDECGRIVEQLDRHLENAVMITGTDNENDESECSNHVQKLPAEITKPIKDLRRKFTDSNIETLQKHLTKHLKEKRNLTDDQLTACKKFVDDCIKYAWMMQIQDPPVYIVWEFEHGSKIDNNVLRSYTKAGDYVDFIVWPVLYLHKDGPVLNKGVVQPMQQTPSSDV